MSHQLTLTELHTTPAVIFKRGQVGKDLKVSL
jgi:hypothetical protein